MALIPGHSMLVLSFINLNFALFPVYVRSTGTERSKLGSTVVIPCVQHSPIQFLDGDLVKWYKSTKKDRFENGDEALASRHVSRNFTTDLTKYNMENDFSLVVKHTTVQDEGFYRCRVVANTGAILDHDVNLALYARPSLLNPEITGCSSKNSCKVETMPSSQLSLCCIIRGVYPLQFPVWESSSPITNFSAAHENGTFFAAVCTSLFIDTNTDRIETCSITYNGNTFNSMIKILTLQDLQTVEPSSTVTTSYAKTDTCLEVEEPLPSLGTTGLVLIIVQMTIIVVICVLHIWRSRHCSRNKTNTKSGISSSTLPSDNTDLHDNEVFLPNSTHNCDKSQVSENQWGSNSTDLHVVCPGNV